jgi:hypothetical protein
MLPPAPLSSLVQFPPLVVGLPAAPPMMLNRFVQVVLGMRDSPLTPLHTFRVCPRHTGEQK